MVHTFFCLQDLRVFLCARNESLNSAYGLFDMRARVRHLSLLKQFLRALSANVCKGCEVFFPGIGCGLDSIKLAMRSLLLVIIFMGVLTVKAEPVKVLRLGDSITRLTATNPELYDKLTEAGIEVVFVGSQRPYPDREGLVTACEGFNGRRIEFFTTHQATYGDEPYNDNCPMADAIPLKRALEEEKPDVVLVMVGVNNLEGR